MYELDFPVLGEPSKYAYANAVLAIMEKKLLNQSQLDQLRVAGSMKEFTRMLSETGYVSYLEEGKEISDILEIEMIRTRDELYEILPDEIHWFFEVFYRKYDYNNLKMLLKSNFLERSFPLDELSRVGTILPVELQELVEGEKFDELPFEVDFDYIENSMSRSRELRLIDAVLDKAYYNELLGAAGKLGDSFFLDFIKQQIDLKNIVIFIRCKRTGLVLERFLLDGGYIDLDVFERYSGENMDILTSSSDFYMYRSIIEKGLISLKKSSSYGELETAIRNYFISLLTEVRHYFFTVKPFIGYLLAKEHELNLLKKFYIYISNLLEFESERDLSYA